MPVIHLKTFIRASVERCFNLARNIDVHVAAACPLQHRAIGGVTSGLIKLGEEVTWEATVLGVRQRLTSKIIALEAPRTFTDEMQRGPFKRWRHTHLFAAREGGTLMTDDVEFTSPFGILGVLVDRLVLKNYLTEFLVAHNQDIKNFAEDSASPFRDSSASQIITADSRKSST